VTGGQSTALICNVCLLPTGTEPVMHSPHAVASALLNRVFVEDGRRAPVDEDEAMMKSEACKTSVLPHCTPVPAFVPPLGTHTDEIFHMLIDAGADVNTYDTNGQTALFFAARLGRADILQSLLDHGASINVRDSFGETALFHAGARGNVCCFDMLVAAGSEFSVLNSVGSPVTFGMCEFGKLSSLRYVLRKGH
jgi:hypothetical protein